MREIEARFLKVAGGDSGPLRKALSEASMLRVDAEEGGLEALSGSLESGSLFAERRLVVVEHAMKADEAVQLFLQERLERLAASKDVFIFWEAIAELPEHKLASELKDRAAKVQEFKKPSKAASERRLSETLKEKGVSLTVFQKEELLARAGDNLWRLESELEKMLLDVEKRETSAAKAASPNIFALTDALGAKDKRRALWLMYRFTEDGIQPERMFWTVAWHLKNLVVFRSFLDAGHDVAYAIKATKQNPFVVKKGMEQARKFTRTELGRLYRQLVDLDLDAKRNKADMALGLERLVLSI